MPHPTDKPGLPSLTPTTRLATSRAFSSQLPVWISICWLLLTRLPDGNATIRQLQRVLDFQRRNVVSAEFVGIQQHPHLAAGAADGGHFAGAGNTFQLDFHRVRHAFQIESAALSIGSRQGQGNNRHVIDTLGLMIGSPTPSCADTQSRLACGLHPTAAPARLRGRRPPCIAR